MLPQTFLGGCGSCVMGKASETGAGVWCTARIQPSSVFFQVLETVCIVLFDYLDCL